MAVTARPPRGPRRRNTTIAVVGAAALLSIGALASRDDATPSTTDMTSAISSVVPTSTTASPSTTDGTTSAAPTTAATTTAVPTTPPSTAAPTTAAPPAAGLLALDVLGTIVVTNEHRGGYVREAFSYPADFDGDGCDTRDEVLQAESVTPAHEQGPGCTIVGEWRSLYDGVETASAGDLQIDHVVALKEAWDSGAWKWDPLTMAAYANDTDDGRTLRAVTSSTNLSKGDKDPSNWLPPDSAAVCTFIGDWVSIKARWTMTMDQSEYGRIRNLLKGPCAGTTIAPFQVVLSTVNPAGPPTSASATTVAFVDPGTGGGSVYYKNCDAARAAGAAPLHVGDPGYRSGLDRDGDGVACE